MFCCIIDNGSNVFCKGGPGFERENSENNKLSKARGRRKETANGRGNVSRTQKVTVVTLQTLARAYKNSQLSSLP